MKIAVTGVPCVGKTTVSKLLAKKLKYRYVSINDLAEEVNAHEGYDKRLGSKIVNVKKVSKEINKLKGNIILDGHFSHDFNVDIIIVLRLNPKILEKRLRKKYPRNLIKVKENLDSEILGVITSESIEHNKVYEIDTTNKKPGSIVKEIIFMLKDKKRNSKIGDIDWFREGFEPSR